MGYVFVRWWVVFTIITVAVVSVLWESGARFLLDSDVTYISWLILIVFAIGSLNIGWRVVDARRKERAWESKFPLTNYLIGTCTSLGLLGTIIGLIIMITGAFSSLDIADHASVKQSLLAMSSGIGTALVTTLVGLVCAILLKFQLAVVTGGRHVQ